MILPLLPALIGAAAVLALFILVVCAVIAGGRADDRLGDPGPLEAPAVNPPRRPAPVVSLELERARRRRVA